MPAENESIVFEGRIGEVVHILQPDGRKFEQYRRSPGVRLIVVSPEGKVLVTREMRHEMGQYDVRLPGGKVCDSLSAYTELRNSKADMQEAARLAAQKEAAEETGLEVRNLEFIVKATAGATVEWDLYYFLAKEYSEHPQGQHLESGEDIEVMWMSPSEIRKSISEGNMQEWRSVGVLLGLVLPIIDAEAPH
jgi:8-oxo-dGTP pyrophosphatase MutT (NUDIX family)